MFPSPSALSSSASATFLHLGLTGWPLAHSLSPALHQAALRAAGLEGDYQLFPVMPLPEGAAALEVLIAGLRQGVLHGLNVTIPHKQAVLPYLDALTPAAQSAGAANTIFQREGQIRGDNTDIPGFLADLEAVAGRLLRKLISQGTDGDKQALVLGAGGAARGVACGLVQSGWQVHVAARRPEQAQGLATELSNSSWSGDGRPRIDAHSLTGAGLAGLLPRLKLIVNATPLGMLPWVEASPWPAGLPLPTGAIVYDLVYNPSETAFLRQARAAGLPAFNGLGMLIEQAALAFETWTGQPAQRQAMRHAAKEALAK
jgi:shikimate dehydrogenase